jgi:DHA2 family multidrug resistance protein
MRNLGGALGIALCSTVLNDRTNLHFFRLAEHLNATNAAMGDALQGLASRYSAAGADAATADASAFKQLWSLTYREALTMTFGDIYLLLMVGFVVTVVLVPVMRKVGPPKAPSADAH